MSITATNSTRSGNTTTISVTSSLAAPVYFHWYMDGVYLGRTGTGRKTINLQTADQGRITILDTNDPAFDPVTNAPAGYSAKRTLAWVRSIDANIRRYRVEQQQDGGAWVTIGYVQDDPSHWLYSFVTTRLVDLSTYSWRVFPIDKNGNDGTPLALATEKIVRSPDAPSFTITFTPSSGTPAASVAFS